MDRCFWASPGQLRKKKEMGGEIGGLKDGDVQGGWGVAFM